VQHPKDWLPTNAKNIKYIEDLGFLNDSTFPVSQKLGESMKQEATAY